MRTSASNFSLSHGFWTKLVAPACIAFTRVFDCAVSGDHDYRKLGIVSMQLRQQLQAIAVRQRQVEQHQIERAVRRCATVPGQP